MSFTQIRNKPLIFGAVLLQLLILSGMILLALKPLVTGQEIRLSVIPKDPRDLFRGNYVDLNYAYRRPDLAKLKHDFAEDQHFYEGDKLYVTLSKKGSDYVATGLYQKPPENQVFLRVFPTHDFVYKKTDTFHSIWLRAGIEKYFTDPKTAKEMQNKVSGRDKWKVTAIIMVDDDGVSRIKDLEFKKI